MASERLAEGTRAWRFGRAAAGAAGLLFAGVYLIEGSDLRMGTLDEPGPGIFPLIVGVLFALVSLAVIGEALLTGEAGRADFPKGRDLVRLAVIAVAFLAYVLLLDVIGFLLATAVFVAFYCLVVGRTSWLVGLATGVGIAGLIFLLFDLVLEVRLPEAIWS